jgi:hypothetical protein
MACNLSFYLYNWFCATHNYSSAKSALVWWISIFIGLSFILYLNNSMELSPSWEAANCAAAQEFPNVSWNQKVHCVHKSPLLVPILCQMKPVHNITSFLLAFPPKSYLHSSFPPFMLHTLLTSPFLTWLFWLCLAKRTSYEAPHYVVFSNFHNVIFQSK